MPRQKTEPVVLADTSRLTFSERLELLKEQKENLKMQQRKLQDAMDRLDFKISRYQAAVETGRLSWDDHR